MIIIQFVTYVNNCHQWKMPDNALIEYIDQWSGASEINELNSRRCELLIIYHGRKNCIEKKVHSLLNLKKILHNLKKKIHNFRWA